MVSSPIVYGASCRLAALRQGKGEFASVRTLSPAFSPFVAFRYSRSLLFSCVTHSRTPRSQCFFLHIGMHRRHRRSPWCLTPSNQEVRDLDLVFLFTHPDFIIDMSNPSIKLKLELLKLHNCPGPSLRVNRRASLSFLKVSRAPHDSSAH